MEWPVGMSATREDRPCPPSQNHGVSMGLPRGKASGKVGGKGRRPVRGVGGGREDQAVSQWAQLPHSSHAPVEVKKPENLSKMGSVFSKRESTSRKSKADFLHGKEASSGDKAGYFS